MECEICGGTLEPGTNKCEYCGHENTVVQSAEVQWNQNSNASIKLSCPRCSSPKISIVSEKKAFDAKKALIGGVLTGGVGLVAGFIGKKIDLYLCSECGYKWEVPTESITEKIKKAF